MMLVDSSRASTTLDPSMLSLSTARSLALTRVQQWLGQGLAAVASSRSAPAPTLLHTPDIGPTCEVLLADQLFHDLTATERNDLLAFVRASQDESGAWLDVTGSPDLSLTVFGWWARRQCGDDPGEPSMVRARRVVHSMGGAQRAHIGARLWLAMGGQLPWSYLPAIPGEVFLMPRASLISMSRLSPWARGMLLPYVLIAKASVRLQLADATPLMLAKTPDRWVTPRLTRPGLAGDLLQTLDRTIRVARKLPRGPMPRWGLERAREQLLASQQAHGGWFSFRPTLLALVAIRGLGVPSNDPRLQRGLTALRANRGRITIPYGPHRGTSAFAQGTGAPSLRTMAPLVGLDGQTEAVRWLLAQQLTRPGPWQTRADAPVGGWPLSAGSEHHLDLEATCEAMAALAELDTDHPEIDDARAAIRRGVDILMAMQEADGGFARFERGESRAWLRRLPWREADMLALGDNDDPPHIRLTAMALTRLAQTGFRLDDDRVSRGLSWLTSQVADLHDHSDVVTLTALAECAGALCGAQHNLRNAVEWRLRAKQREDGSFGGMTETALAVRGLLALGDPCVQAIRAMRWIVERLQTDEHALDDSQLSHEGVGLTPWTLDRTAAAREVLRTLTRFEQSGGSLSG